MIGANIYNQWYYFSNESVTNLIPNHILCIKNIKLLPEHRVTPTNNDAIHAVAPLLSLKTSKNSVYRTPNE